MAPQLSSNTLSPQLRSVLGSLNINLEAELNRYRRSSFVEGPTTQDLFADLENDAAFDLDSVNTAVVAPAATLPMSPPPVPRNKKIFPDEPAAQPSPSFDVSALEQKRELPAASSASTLSMDAVPPSSPPSGDTASAANSRVIASSALTVPVGTSSASSAESMQAGMLAAKDDLATAQGAAIASSTATNASPDGYLTSSEKLIESLNEVPSMPDPVASTVKPKRKTVSLLMGAMLGFFALVAGLGASYLMSNPSVAQRFANGFKRGDGAVSSASNSSFDPPGPDLSAREFIDLEIDNLSSLKMPQATIDPASNPAVTGAPSSPIALPPIANGVAQSSAVVPTQTVVLQPSAQSLPQPNATQASLIPAGSNYYITVPFTTEQVLIQIRQTVDEAFVRQYADGGNRIQLAAFDNATSAQQFIEELKVQGVTAQVYGPTAE